MKCNQKWFNHIDIKAFIDALTEASDEELNVLFQMIQRSYNHLPRKGQCCGFDGWNIFGPITDAIFNEKIARKPESETLLGILKKLEADAFEAGAAHASC